MYKRFILLLFISTLFTAEITNIFVQQRTDGSGIIEVTYDLIDSDGIYPSFNVSLEMSIDGEEYSIVNPYSISGDAEGGYVSIESGSVLTFDGFGVPFVSDKANVPIFSPDAIKGKNFFF